jgi:thioredoxin reductase
MLRLKKSGKSRQVYIIEEERKMKMRIKVEFITGSNIEELQENVNKALEAIQLNVKNNIVEVKTISAEGSFVSQIAYAELEELEKEPLMEGDQVNVSKN